MQTLPILFASVCLFSIQARAGVLVREDFSSYANGTITTPTSLTGGAGWSGGWSYANNGANLQIVDKAWSSFPGYGFTPTKAVTTTGATGLQFNRLINTNAVNFTVPGTYYFSLLVDNENTVEAYFTGATNNGNPANQAEALIKWQDGASSDFEGTMNTVAIGNTVGLLGDKDYLLVGKMVISATVGADSLSFAFFSAGQNVSSEPVWGVGNSRSGTGNFDAFNRFGLNLIGSPGNNPLIGNMVVGQSYADVIAYTPVTPPVPKAMVSLRTGDAVIGQWLRNNPDGWTTLKAQVDMLHGSDQDLGGLFVTQLHQNPQYFDGIEIGDVPDNFTNAIIGEIQDSERYGWKQSLIALRRETLAGNNGPPGPFAWAPNMLAQVDVDDCRAAIVDAYNRKMVTSNQYNLLYLGSAATILAAITNAPSETVLLTMDGIAVEIHYNNWDNFTAIMNVAKAIKWCQDHNKIAQVHLGGKLFADMQEGFIPFFQRLWSDLATLGVDYRNPGIIYHHNVNDRQTTEVGPESEWGQALWFTRWLINEVKLGSNSVAPAIPTGLTASAGSSSVILDWNDNTDTDLFSYRVYRSTGGAYTLLQDGLPRRPFTDMTAPNGTLCYYQVTAVDQWGNESARSTEVGSTSKAAGTGDILVGWHFPSTTMPDNSPDLTLPGVTGFLAALQTVTNANSTDGSYGSVSAVIGTPANALRVNGQTAQNSEANLVHVTISNGTGSPITLGTFHCDYAVANSYSPKSLTLYYEGGNLAVTPNTFIGTSLDGTAGIMPVVGTIGDFTDLNWNLGVLNDTVLGVGESATFRLEAGAWATSDKAQSGYIDNIAITRPPVFTGGADPVFGPLAVTPGGNMALTIYGLPGTFPVQASETLAPGSWINIGTIQIGQQNEAIFLDRLNSQRRFYRIQLTP